MSEGNRLVVVTGGPGTGKSVLAANIESDVAIFCESDGAVATARAALNAVILGLYEEFNFDAPKEKEGVDRTLERDIDDYLVKPWVDDKSFKREVTVVIDGLDEAAGSPELADVLGSCAGSLPTWLRIVVFTRPEAIIADALCRSNRAERICMEDDVEAREAVSKYCADRLGKGSFAAKRAAQIADGLFILARLLCDEYKNNPKFLFDGANGLNELYAVMVSARVKDNPHVATVLGLVSAAPGITAGLLEKCLSWNSYFGGFEPTPRVSLETAKRHLASLLTFGEGDDPVVPFHQSFAEWMAGADSELVTPVEEVDEALAQACSKEFSEARERGEWPCDFVMENVVPFVKSISSDFDASASDMAALIIWNTQRAEAHGVNGDFETELRCRRTVYDLSTRLYCTGEFHDVGYAVPHLADAAYRASCAANAAGKLEECVDFCACGLRFLFESRPNDKISLMKWWATNCDIQALYAFQLTLRQAMTLSRLNRMSECNEAFLEARRFCRLSSNKVALTRTLRQWANCFGKEPDDKSKKYALEKVFEIDEAWGGNLYALKDEDGAEYVMVLVDKATHLLHNGRISDALLLLNEASKLINGDAPEVVLGKNDLSQLHLITSRALRAKESGDGKRLSKALANARIAAALKEEVQGSRSAGAATCRCEVAHCLLAMGRAKQALEIYEDALRIRRAIYGEGSSQVHTAESFVKKARAVIDETERARAEKRARGRK